jgi:hypothetical protein
MAGGAPCCAPCARASALGNAKRRHSTSAVALPETRIIHDAPARPAARPVVAAEPPARFGVRARQPADLPWIESWSASLGLPALPAGRVRSRVLLIDGQRVGFIAGRDDWLDVGRGRENVLWIAAAFLVPSARGQGNLMRFAQLLTTELYPQGVTLATRVAAHNQRMQQFMRVGGWRKLSSTRQHSDFVLELRGPYRAKSRVTP